MQLPIEAEGKEEIDRLAIINKIKKKDDPSPEEIQEFLKCVEKSEKLYMEDGKVKFPYNILPKSPQLPTILATKKGPKEYERFNDTVFIIIASHYSQITRKLTFFSSFYFHFIPQCLPCLYKTESQFTATTSLCNFARG